MAKVPYFLTTLQCRTCKLVKAFNAMDGIEKVLNYLQCGKCHAFGMNIIRMKKEPAYHVDIT